MSFRASLNLGAVGEMLYHQAHCGTLNRTNGRAGDFVNRETGDIVELKTDYYPMDKTPNFFFERFSDGDKKSPGGPWQALGHGCKTFVYFFVANMTTFTFDTAQLVAHLDSIEHTLEPFKVGNSTWTTIGYRVPREVLAPLYETMTLTVTVSK